MSTRSPSGTSSPSPSRIPQPFQSDSIVLVRLGSGGQALSGTALTPLTLLELSPTGQQRQTLELSPSLSLLGCPAPVAAATIQASCPVIAQGLLYRSLDKRYLTLAAIQASPGTPHSLVLNASSVVKRSVVRLDWLGQVDATTTWTGFRSTTTSVSAALTKDGLTHFAIGGLPEGGVRSIANGAITASVSNLDSTANGYYKGARFNVNGTSLFFTDSFGSTADPFDNGANYITLMDPISTTSQPINDQYLMLSPLPGYAVDFVFVDQGTRLFVADYSRGLRVYSRTSVDTYQELAISPLLPGGSTLVLGLEVDEVAQTLFVTTPSALYKYAYGTDTWTALLSAGAGYEFRGVALAPTPLPTPSATATWTASASFTASSTATSGATRTGSATGSSTATSGATGTGSASSTSTRSATSSKSSVGTATASASSTSSTSASSSPSNTATSTPSPTSTPTPTPTSSSTPSSTGSPTPTTSPTPTPTGTPSTTSTPTPTPTPTMTPTPSSTRTLSGTATSSSTSTGSATATSSATSTGSASATGTSSASTTSTGSASATGTPTGSATGTGSASATYTTWPRTLTFQTPCVRIPIVVPAMVRSVRVAMWGAGGGAQSASTRLLAQGGAGAFVGGMLRVTPGETLYASIGLAGRPGGPQGNTTCGGGGAAGQRGGSGGGATRLERANGQLLLLAAGGGGASGYQNTTHTGRLAAYGGAGGLDQGGTTLLETYNTSLLIRSFQTGATLQRGGLPIQTNGTCPVCSFESGQSQRGGASNCSVYGSGGGGGFFGGAGACLGAAGGGSSYSVFLSTDVSEAGFMTTPGGTFSRFFQQGIANGQTDIQPAGNGSLTLEWTWPAQESDTATPSPSASLIPPSLIPTPTATPAVVTEQTHIHRVCYQGPVNATGSLPVRLTCPPGTLIAAIHYANCGTNTGSCGSYMRGTLCSSQAATTNALTAACVNKNNCSVVPSTFCGSCYTRAGTTLYADIACGVVPAQAIAQTLQAAKDSAQSLGTTRASLVSRIRLRSTYIQSEGQMRFGELLLLNRSGLNVLSPSTAVATASSTMPMTMDDWYTCGVPLNSPLAAIDGNLCSYVRLQNDPVPWWSVQLNTPIPIGNLTTLRVFTADILQDLTGLFYDYSYQIDGATLELLGASGQPILAVTLPWLSQLPRPYSLNLTDIALSLP